MRSDFTLSVIIPVFNERLTIRTLIDRVCAVPIRKEIIIVDDGSSDGTADAVRAIAAAGDADPMNRIRALFHAQNAGKGAAIRTAIEAVSGDIALIQDADLEYDPAEYPTLIEPILAGHADVVFGSRFLGGPHRVLFFRHTMGNRLLTFLSNLCTDLNLTDMETCYKVFRTDVLQRLHLASDRFGIEPEITAKVARLGVRVYEVPISYHGREYWEGKKIGWKDGFRALAAIVRFKVSDLICKPDEYGSEVAVRLGRAPNYTRWLADLLRPHLGSNILEIGAGTGSLLLHLVPRTQYWACDANPLFVRELRKLMATRPYLGASGVDPADPSSLPAGQKFDTIICQNVLEHVEDDAAVLRGIGSVVGEGGRIIVLAPNSPSLFGAIDRSLGHRRRYTRDGLRRLAEQAGMQCVSITPFNRACSLPWWISGRMLRRRRFSLLQVKWVNWMTPILRKLDPYLPLPPLSLIAVIEKRRPSDHAGLEASPDELAAPLGRG